MYRRAPRVQARVEHPGIAEPVEPRPIRDERRLMHVTGDHHRWLIGLDPLRKFDVAEKTFAAPARGRIGRRRVMYPHPSLQPSRSGVAKLILDPLLHERTIPPRTDRE